MEHGPFTDDFPNETSIYNGFSIAMLNYQRVPCYKMVIFHSYGNVYQRGFQGCSNYSWWGIVTPTDQNIFFRGVGIPPTR